MEETKNTSITIDRATRDQLQQMALKDGCKTVPEYLRRIARIESSAGGSVSVPPGDAAVASPPAPIPDLSQAKKEGEPNVRAETPRVGSLEPY